MNYTHFALQKLHILPTVLEAMSQKEKAVVYSSIDLRIEEEKRLASQMK